MEPRSIVAEPALSSRSSDPSAATPRSAVVEPALSCRSTSSVGAWGSVICQTSRSPKAQKAPVRSGDLTSSAASLDLICGLAPFAPWPATCHALPACEAIVRFPQLSCRLTEPGFPSVPSRVGNWDEPTSLPQAPDDNAPTPAAEQAAYHQSGRRGHDDAPDEGESGAAQDEPDADADEDERPEAPQASDLVIGQVARSSGEWDHPGEDQEDPPAQVTTTYTHTENGSRLSRVGNGRRS